MKEQVNSDVIYCTYKNVRNVNLQSNTVRVDKSAFIGNMKISKLSFNENLHTIEEESFKGCSNLKKVYFPLKTILFSLPKSCFENCTKLELISIPKSIEKIESRCFANCTSIKVLTIPKGINELSLDAFMGWNENQEIIIHKEYGDFIECKAKVTKLIDNEKESDEVTRDKDTGKRYFAVTCKCGHVSKQKFMPITFAIVANNRKEASEIARKMPRVKHNHKFAILSNFEISYSEFKKIIEHNDEDPYLNVNSKHEQKEIMHLIKHRLVSEEIDKPIVKKKKKPIKKFYDGKVIIRNPKKYMI